MISVKQDVCENGGAEQGVWGNRAHHHRVADRADDTIPEEETDRTTVCQRGGRTQEQTSTDNTCKGRARI